MGATKADFDSCVAIRECRRCFGVNGRPYFCRGARHFAIEVEIDCLCKRHWESKCEKWSGEGKGGKSKGTGRRLLP